MPVGDFVYVPDPFVEAVKPQSVPLYGSSPVAVRFNTSYAFLAATNQVGVRSL